ncbi:MAG: PKD domain-containing protein [Saprospiraceae bacterium]
MKTMVKILSVNLLLLFISLSAFSQSDTLRALYLGNSYTYVNSLPQLTQSLATAANKTLIIDNNTPGGYTLEGHSTNSTSLNKIMQGNWDFVILQEQSQIPTIDYHRYNSMYPAVEALNDTIKKYNPCAKVVMYMTWGRRFGGQQCDQGGVNCSPAFADFSQMQDSLESAYTGIANSIRAYVAPVGIAWKNVIEDTTIVLHSGDNSHPNYNGSYLAASVFHSILWNESPVGLSFAGSLSNPLAAYFQQVADSTVFHSYSDWNVNIDNVIADYSYNIVGDSVQFTNLSQSLSPVAYSWDFGDGNTSNDENPSHTYAANQTYSVSLIVEYCSKKDTIIQTITINTVSVEQVNFQSLIKVFPNPVLSNLEISIDKEPLDLNLKIINSIGKVVAIYDVNNEQNITYDLAFLPSGLYFLQLLNKENNEKVIIKIVKK